MEGKSRYEDEFPEYFSWCPHCGSPEHSHEGDSTPHGKWLQCGACGRWSWRKHYFEEVVDYESRGGIVTDKTEFQPDDDYLLSPTNMERAGHRLAEATNKKERDTGVVLPPPGKFRKPPRSEPRRQP